MPHHRLAPAITFQAELIAGPNTRIPGRTTDFQFLGFPALDAAPFGPAFSGSDGTFEGIYQFDQQKVLRKVVDDATPLPDLSGTFKQFSTYQSVSANGGDVAFAATGSTGVQGIFVAGAGAVATLALAGDVCTSGGHSCLLQTPSLSGNGTAFARVNFTSSPPLHDALYLYSGACIKTVVDTSTPIPGGTGAFDNFGPFMLDNGELAFIGGRNKAPQQMGVYRTHQGAVERIADFNMMAPGTAQPFSYFWKLAAWQGQVVFSASFGTAAQRASQGGLYRSQNGVLEALVDSSMASPSGFGKFAGFGQPSLSTTGIAFVGYGPNPNPHAGIYFRDPAGNLTAIADDMHAFFGDRLTNSMDLNPQALNGQQLAIAVIAEGIGQKVYLVSWPVT